MENITINLFSLLNQVLPWKSGFFVPIFETDLIRVIVKNLSMEEYLCLTERLENRSYLGTLKLNDTEVETL